MHALRQILDVTRPTLLAALILPTLVLTALSATDAAAQGRERILAFDSHVTVHPDGALTVTETIAVQAGGNHIKRGIYRDFPTLYDTPSGVPELVRFDVERVARDGRREAYFTERKSNGVRVYIGEEDVFLDPGRYTYTLTYTTTRQIAHGSATDELAWNVTGNGWVIPIDRVSATVELPSGATIAGYDAYTGRFGETGKDFRAERTGDGSVRFETTAPLDTTEGMTVAVSWPSGIVAAPKPIDGTLDLVLALPMAKTGLVGLVVLLVYFVAVWIAFGRDPAGGAVMVRYQPPKGVSPAATRYVRQHLADNTAFAAAVINLAVKGHVSIEDTGKAYTLTRETSSARVSSGERAILNALFTWRDRSITLDSSNHEIVSDAENRFSAALLKEYDAANFTNHIGYTALGVAITLATVATMCLFAFDAGTFLGVTIFLTVVQALGTGAAYIFLPKLGLEKFSRRYTAVIILSLLALAAVLAAAVWLVFGSMAADYAIVLAIIAAMHALTGIFAHLIEAPTRAGRKLLDEIAGFREYLSAVEQDPMNTRNPPERTPELFEKFLPYAVALGVENEWGEAFADVVIPGKGWEPGWYRGRRFSQGTRGFSSSLSGGFSSAISSASTAPSSGSGRFSSGGGFSGGGGGGGGGGGW